MTVDELISELEKLRQAGFGDRHVSDTLGNDVCAALPPRTDDDPTSEVDERPDDVMLDCRIDYDRERP